MVKKETSTKDKKVKAKPVASKVAAKTKATKAAPKAAKKVVAKKAELKIADKTLKKVAPVKKTVAKVETVVKEVKKPKTIKTAIINSGDPAMLKKYQHNKADTGSTEVQIVLFTDKIEKLSKHLKKNGKDFDSKRGLLMMVSKRRRLLNYLRERGDDKSYKKLVGDLGLKG